MWFIEEGAYMSMRPMKGAADAKILMKINPKKTILNTYSVFVKSLSNIIINYKKYKSMRTRFFIFLILALGVIGVSGLPENHLFKSNAYTSYDFEYEFGWSGTPPEDATEVPVWITYLSYDTYLNLERHTLNNTIWIKADSVYLPIVKLWIPPFYCSYESNNGWLRGVVEGDKITFKKNDPVANVTVYQIENNYTQGILKYTDTVVSYKELRIWGASDFSPTSKKRDRESEILNSEVRFMSTETDVVGQYNDATHTISHLNSGLLISTRQLSAIRTEKINDWEKPTLTQVLPGLLVGELSETDPISLPKPEIETRVVKESHSFRGSLYTKEENCYMDVRLDLVSPEGRIIDPEKIFIRAWVDGEQKEDMPFSEYGNPFSIPVLYNINLYGWYYFLGSSDPEPPSLDYYNPALKVMCYYLKEDGTTVESPCAYRNHPEGIYEIDNDPGPSTTVVGNGKVYDLSGREVNPDRLSPGIYIRDGRKFIVTPH